MTRRKSVAQSAPQSLSEAVAQLGRYAALAAGLADLEGDRDASIAAINATADRLIAPLEAELREIFRQIRPWWAVAGPDLTEGKRKSIELGGCIIGQRTTPPKLHHDGKEEDAIARLRTAGWCELLRVTEKLDKPALLKMLLSDTAAVTIAPLGFERRQQDEFFIDRLPPKADAVEVVPTGEAG